MSENKTAKPLTDQEKQIQPLPDEIDPKDAKVNIFLALQKIKRRFTIKK